LDEKLQPQLKSQRRGQAGYCALQKRRESVEKALIGLGSGLQAAGIARGTSSDGRGAFAALSLVFILEECTALASSVDAEPGVGTSESAQKSADCARRFWELTRAARDLAGDQNSGLQAIDGQLGVVENTVVGLSNLVLRGTHLQASLRELEQLERSKFGYKLLDKFVSERKLLAMSSAYAIFSITGMVFLSGLFWDYREGLLLHTSVEDFVLAGFRLGFWAIAGGTAVLLVVVVSRRWVRAAGPTTLGQPSRFRTRMLRIANPIVLLPALLLVSLGAAWGLGYGQLHLLQSEDARVGALSRGMRWIYGDPRSSTIRLADKTIHSGIIMSRPNSDFVLIKPRDRSYLTVPRREIRCIATREDDCARVPSIGQPATLTSADRAFEQLTTR
jgi:hypothetical protein